MSGQHTPGPWAVHPVSARVDAFSGGTPLPVCELLWPTDERSEAETEANAHLIAAAPEMLDALDGLTPILEAAESNASGNPEWAWVSKRINAARAAIGKARGAA